MTGINYNAIHEAGHVIVALCCELDVREVLIKPSGKYTARCEFSPTQEAPSAVYMMKVAGAVAVQIQNEKLGLADDDGFGKPDDAESDAYCTERLRLYWRALCMTDNQVKACDVKLRENVKLKLSSLWPVVEALAVEIATLRPSGRPLTAARIGETISAVAPTFYDSVKAHLLMNDF
jgi:hypothetical protein